MEEKEFGTVEYCDRSGVFESVELERGWTLRGLHGHFLVEDFDAHRLRCFAVASMFQKIGWSERWCTRIVHAVRTLGRIAMLGSHRDSEMERSIEDCWWCYKMECGRAGWTDDFHFSPFASKGKKVGRFRDGFDGNPGIREWETQTTFDPGWRLQRGPVRYDRLFPCGRVDPKTKNAGGHERLIARGSFAHDGGRTAPDGDKHVDERRLRTRAFHTIQLVKTPADSLTQMDFIMTSRKLEMKHVQVLDSDWFKTDHRAVLAVLSLKPNMRYTKRYGANLRGWEPDDPWHRVAAETLTEWENWNVMVPLLMEKAKTHRRMETKELSVTELELKSLLLRKKKAGR